MEIGNASSNMLLIRSLRVGSVAKGSHFIIAMLFIVFDVEAVFLYPWAIVFKQFNQFRAFVFIEMIVFIGILLVGFIYAWKKGALEWE